MKHKVYIIYGLLLTTMEPELLDFKCNVSTNQITYRYYANNEAHIEYSHVDESIPRSFLVLLRDSVDTLNGRGCKFVVQLVLKTDWDNFLTASRWRIRESVNVDNNECLVVECNMADVIECIASGLGINF